MADSSNDFRTTDYIPVDSDIVCIDVNEKENILIGITTIEHHYVYVLDKNGCYLYGIIFDNPGAFSACFSEEEGIIVIYPVRDRTLYYVNTSGEVTHLEYDEEGAPRFKAMDGVNRVEVAGNTYTYINEYSIFGNLKEIRVVRAHNEDEIVLFRQEVSDGINHRYVNLYWIIPFIVLFLLGKIDKYRKQRQR